MSILTTVICILITSGWLGTYASFLDPDRHTEPRFSVKKNYLYSFIVFTVIFAFFHIMHIFVGT